MESIYEPYYGAYYGAYGNQVMNHIVAIKSGGGSKSNSDLLYEKFGVDKAEYPYIWIRNVGGSTSGTVFRLMFLDNLYINSSSIGYAIGTKYKQVDYITLNSNAPVSTKGLFATILLLSNATITSDVSSSGANISISSASKYTIVSIDNEYFAKLDDVSYPENSYLLCVKYKLKKSAYPYIAFIGTFSGQYSDGTKYVTYSTFFSKNEYTANQNEIGYDGSTNAVPRSNCSFAVRETQTEKTEKDILIAMLKESSPSTSNFTNTKSYSKETYPLMALSYQSEFYKNMDDIKIDIINDL